MGLLDWISDGGLTSPIFGGGMVASIPGPSDSAPPVQQTGDDAAAIRPPDMSGNMGRPPDPSAMGSPAPPAAASNPQIPDPSLSGSPAPPSAGAMPPDPSASGSPPSAASTQPVPMPQPRPPGAPQGMPGSPPGMPSSGPAAQPGAPTSLAPPEPGPSAAPGSPAQTWLGRALGITPQQGQQMGSGLAAGLKSVGDNWSKPGLAAFSGSAGSAMEGSQKKSETQQKQAADYLKASIDSKKAGDEAGYKQNYLKYLAAKLEVDTNKAASKDAGANKNDTPTQLYLAAQRLVQGDKEVRDAGDALKEARKNGTPEEVAKAQAALQQVTQAKQAEHFSALGLHPQTAAQLSKQPGNAQENPIDAGKLGITKDNIGQKLQPGQYFTNPADGKVYQYKAPTKDKGSSKAIPDKPTSPEPPDPMHPSKSPLEAGAGDDD